MGESRAPHHADGGRTGARSTPGDGRARNPRVRKGRRGPAWGRELQVAGPASAKALRQDRHCRAEEREAGWPGGEVAFLSGQGRVTVWVPFAEAPLYRAWNLDRPRVRGRTSRAWGSCATSWRPLVWAAASPHCLPRRFSPQLPACSARSWLCGECLRLSSHKALPGQARWRGGAGRALQQHQAARGAGWCPPPEGAVVSQAATGTGSGLAVSSSSWRPGPSMGTVQVGAKPAFTPTSTHGAPATCRREAFGASAQVAASPRPPQVREAGSPGPLSVDRAQKWNLRRPGAGAWRISGEALLMGAVGGFKQHVAVG